MCLRVVALGLPTILLFGRTDPTELADALASGEAVAILLGEPQLERQREHLLRLQQRKWWTIGAPLRAVDREGQLLPLDAVVGEPELSGDRVDHGGLEALPAGGVIVDHDDIDGPFGQLRRAGDPELAAQLRHRLGARARALGVARRIARHVAVEGDELHHAAAVEAVAQAFDSDAELFTDEPGKTLADFDAGRA